MTSELREAYWRANVRLVSALLVIWFLVSYGFGILFKDALDEVSFFGFKLGFWWAQQGAIFVFLLLIAVYSWQMNKLDHKYGVHEE